MSVVTRTLAHCELTLLEMRADENCATPKWRGVRRVIDRVTGLVYWVRTQLGSSGLWEVTCPNIGDWGTSARERPLWNDSFKNTWLRGVLVAAKDELDAVARVLETPRFVQERVGNLPSVPSDSTWRARVRTAMPLGPSAPSIGTRAAQMVKEALG